MLFLNDKSQERSKNCIKDTRVPFPAVNVYAQKSDAWKRCGQGFSDEKLILFGGPGTPFDLIALLLVHPQYNLPRTRPRLLRTWLMAASVHPPIASFRLSRNQRITSIRLCRHVLQWLPRFPRRESAVTKATMPGVGYSFYVRGTETERKSQ